MFNLGKILQQFTLFDWGLAVAGLLLWIITIYCAGHITENRWGDRESGALIGFFVPGILAVAMMYLK